MKEMHKAIIEITLGVGVIMSGGHIAHQAPHEHDRPWFTEQPTEQSIGGGMEVVGGLISLYGLVSTARAYNQYRKQTPQSPTQSPGDISNI